jgi:hypothetical protein
MRSYAFLQMVAYSHGHAPDPDSVLPYLRDRIPNFRLARAPNGNDRQGVDYVIERHNLPSLGIDLKLRATNFSVRGEDDLALETWSVVEKNIPGWTRDPFKACDFVLWFWRDTGRYFIVPFPPLCWTFEREWELYRTFFRTERQRTAGRVSWTSECVFVPRTVVMADIGPLVERTVPAGRLSYFVSGLQALPISAASSELRGIGWLLSAAEHLRHSATWASSSLAGLPLIESRAYSIAQPTSSCLLR